MSEPATRSAPERWFRCGIAARWLPRVLGAALLASATLAALQIDAESGVPFSRQVRAIVIVAGAAGALWLVRGGSEVRLRLGIGPRAVILASGRRSTEVRFQDIQALDYDPPFGSRRRWIPAVVIVERRGWRWRIPALMADGSRMIEEILKAAGRDDLRSWAEARRLSTRLERARWLVPAGFVASAALVAATLWFVYR